VTARNASRAWLAMWIEVDVTCRLQDDMYA
jgi:hypothetical protein